MIEPIKLYIGIDPGVVNTGWCIRGTKNDGTPFLASGTYNPTALGESLEAMVANAERLYDEFVYQASDAGGPYVFESAAIERYVPYAGKFTQVSEGTCLFIGSLTFLLQRAGIKTTLVRAIDWKVRVAKKLHLESGFNNPSEKLDKKFSKAAAAFILGVKNKQDTHQADATCLSFYAQNFGTTT